MTDYERLTRYMQVGNKVVQVIPQRKERIQAYIDRLFDLEDKIESGELISKKEVERLQAENAALRERLEKAVELPCKIGDEVYEVHGKCDRKNCVYNGYYGQWRCDYGGKTNCNPFITVNKFCYSNIPMVGKTIFVTKEEAEARLKELKGEEK